MPSPDIGKPFYSICMWNMTPDENVASEGFLKKNKGTNNDINK